MAEYVFLIFQCLQAQDFANCMIFVCLSGLDRADWLAPTTYFSSWFHLPCADFDVDIFVWNDMRLNMQETKQTWSAQFGSRGLQLQDSVSRQEGIRIFFQNTLKHELEEKESSEGKVRKAGFLFGMPLCHPFFSFFLGPKCQQPKHMEHPWTSLYVQFLLPTPWISPKSMWGDQIEDTCSSCCFPSARDWCLTTEDPQKMTFGRVYACQFGQMFHNSPALLANPCIVFLFLVVLCRGGRTEQKSIGLMLPLTNEWPFLAQMSQNSPKYRAVEISVSFSKTIWNGFSNPLQWQPPHCV